MIDPLRTPFPERVHEVARFSTWRLVVLQGQGVVVTGSCEVIPCPLFGQPLTFPIELKLIAVGVLMVNAAIAQVVREPGRIRIPTRPSEEAADPRHIEGRRLGGTRILQYRIRVENHRAEEHEIED